MLTLKDFMVAVDYKITEGSDYCWTCYGPNAYSMDSWNQEYDGHSAHIVFDTRTQVVYEMSVCDYKANRAYRYINPDYRKEYENESESRDVPPDEAWDDVKYISLEVESDILEKTTAIFKGEAYDTRVSINIDLDDDEFMQLALMAHKNDITINQMVERILQEAIDRAK